MMRNMRCISFLLLACCFVYAQEKEVIEENVPPPPEMVKEPPKEPPEERLRSPQELEAELSDAEREFERAKSLFNPWYTGPLLTPSAALVPPGHLAIQIYFFFTTNYGVYDEDGHLIHTPHLFQFNPALAPFQFGVSDCMDFSISAQGLYNNRKNPSLCACNLEYFNWGDTSITAGFAIMKETPRRPAMKFAVAEKFPTGHYQHFRADKASVQSTGGGAYVTTFIYSISKLVWWDLCHPKRYRGALQYSIPTHVHVHGINSYGGDPSTRGIVYGGRNFQGDVGYEYSFNQRWVGAIDLVYSWSSARHFCGHTIAPVGGPFSDQLSLAPAIEYNWSSSRGMIAGVWFSVWGRNSGAFHSEIISFTFFF